jgi:hypothetical protein
MSDEQRRDDETEVDGHLKKPLVTGEPAGEDENEVEAHLQKFANVRMDSPTNT